MKANTDELVRRFLLDDLSDEERLQVEQRFLADNEFFAQVLAAEDALLDEFVLSSLSKEEYERAEFLFKSSLSQNQMVTSTRELIALLRESRAKKNQPASAVAEPTRIGESISKFHARERVPAADRATPIRPLVPIPMAHVRSAGRYAMLAWVVVAVAGLALAAGIVQKEFQKKSLEAQSVALEESSRKLREELQTETQRSAELSKQLEVERQKRIASESLVAQLRSSHLTSLTSITLSPTTLERGGGSQIVRVRGETRPIQLLLKLDRDKSYSHYSITITTFDGDRVWSADSLNSSQIKRGRLSVVVPSSLLTPEDYKIEIKGSVENGDLVRVADYIFKVRK